MSTANACQLPASSHLRQSLPRIDYLDSYEVPSSHPNQSLVSIYAAALDHLPPAFQQLLVLRSAIVKPFGIAGVSHRDLATKTDVNKTYAVGDYVGRWILYEQRPHEIITGLNDKHLDFRVSVLRTQEERVVLSTVVMTHNTFGRAYLATILPFHRFGVARLLTNASAAGRL